MAIENGVQNAELGYILDPAFQIENLNGKPVVGGYICIYEAGTDNKYISYENFDGAQNPFKIPLKADGRAVILGDPSLTYDVYAYDSYGNQLFSRLNVQCNVPGNISIKGADTRIKNTDGTLDISLQTMGNNVREYTVNTRNKELGVESPLYFVRNDNSATIIGFSGDGYLTEDKFEYDDNFNITGYDGSAFASNGQTYSAGTNIDITDNVISVTGLPTSSDVENAISSAVTNVENKFEYNENNYITAYNNSAFAGTNYSAGDYVSIENDTISVTGLQPSGDYATHDDLTGYATTALVSSVSSELYSAFSGISGDFELVAGEGVELVDDPNSKTTTINVTAEGTPVTTIEQMIESATSGLQPSGDYATTADLTAKQDTLDYGYHDAAISSIDTSALYDTSAHARINTLAGRISNLSSDKLDASAFSTVSGDFLTAHQDISDLMPKSESANFYPMTGNPSGFLTAHQDISNKLDTTAFSDVSGSFLTAVPDTYLQNTDLTIVDNKITEISGVPLSAGDEFPQSATDAIEYVTATSGDINSTIDNVSANSGVWGGSALPISAGPGIKFEMVDDTLVASTDETVLWSGSTTTGCTLSEYATNFDKVQVTYYSTEGGTARPFITEFPATALSWNFVAEFVGYNDYLICDIACYSSNDCLNYAYERGSHGWYDISQVRAGGNAGTIVGLTKVIGINRVAGGN